MVSLGLNANKDGVNYAVCDTNSDIIAWGTGFITKFSLGNQEELRKLLIDADEITIVSSYFSTYPSQPKRISAAANTTAAIGFLCKELGKVYTSLNDGDVCSELKSDWNSLPEMIHDLTGVYRDSRGRMLSVYGAWVAQDDQNILS
jgi:hypothetical protein